MKPNFFIIGAAKAGTTSLYYYIKQHPDVCMSNPKETWFFCFEDYEKGLKWYWDRYFAPYYRGQKAIGEASVWYLHMPHVALRIKKSIPKAKLIVILRNPAERAFSEWWMAYCDGIETLPFHEAIKVNLQRLAKQKDPLEKTVEGAKMWLIFRGIRSGNVGKIIDKRPRNYIENGYYALQLQKYFELFPKENFKIFLFEDLKQTPEKVIKEIWSFLGIDTNYEISNFTPYNTGFGSIGGKLLNKMRRFHGSKIFPKLFKKKIVNFLGKLGKKPQMDPSIRKFLTEHYLVHNKKLEKLIGRDLSNWMEPF